MEIRRVSFKEYTALYIKFVILQIKSLVEYRGDFFTGMVSVLFVQFTSIFFLSVVFENINMINGYSFHQLLFIHGFSAMGLAINHIFFDNLWVLGSKYIITGNFDKFLVRPINPLFHLIAEKVQLDGFGQLLIGATILIYSMLNMGYEWGYIDLFVLFSLVLFSGIIFASINLFFSTLSFWVIDSLPLMTAVFTINEFSKYPITIYGKIIGFILTFIIPYGFVAFYPASVFIEVSKNMYFYGLLTPFVAILCAVGSYLFWIIGLRSYTSTGN